MRSYQSAGQRTGAHCQPHLMPFWNFRDELSVEDGLVLKGQRIILPKSLHAAALSIMQTKVQKNASFVQRHRSSGVVSIVTSMKLFKSCAPCQAHQVAITKERLFPHDVPKRAWHTLATDLFHWNGTEYIIIGDFYNKFPIIRTPPVVHSPRRVPVALREPLIQRGT